MATNVFFNNFEFSATQNLLSDLVEEMIQIYGIDVYYIPRTRSNTDVLFGEDPSSSFNRAFQIEMYLKNYLGFGGDGDLMSKFGLMAGDTLTMCVARRRFAQDIGDVVNMVRPFEGDLLYFPFTKGVFEIKFVEHEATFYQTGALQFYELRCEKFNYSGETFATGIPEIDGLQAAYGTGSDNFRITTEAGDWLTTEDGLLELVDESFGNVDNLIDGEENKYFETVSDTFIDFSVHDPFSEGGSQ